MTDQQLAQMATARSNGNLEEFESVLAGISEPEIEDAFGPLLLQLDDDEDFDDFGFAVVHAVEIVPDVAYVGHVVAVTPALVHSSPRWSRIIYMRIMNSWDTVRALKSRLLVATADEVCAVETVINDVMQARPEFSERARELLQR